jgi:hypothetical protein
MLSDLENGTGVGPWYEGTAGERIAERLSSTDTNGPYAIVESVAAPGCSPPMHLHRHEEEHFVAVAHFSPYLRPALTAPLGQQATSHARHTSLSADCD